jgi:hypothetical protein
MMGTYKNHKNTRCKINADNTADRKIHQRIFFVATPNAKSFMIALQNYLTVRVHG